MCVFVHREIASSAVYSNLEVKHVKHAVNDKFCKLCPIPTKTEDCTGQSLGVALEPCSALTEVSGFSSVPAVYMVHGFFMAKKKKIYVKSFE